MGGLQSVLFELGGYNKMEGKVIVKRSPEGMHPTCAIDVQVGPLHFYLSEKETGDLAKELLNSLQIRCPECLSEPCFCDAVMVDGYTRRQLKRAFDAVCDPADWKAPISKAVLINDIEITLAAIRYFTGTSPVAGVRKGRLYVDAIVESKGYRLGPCGP